LKFISKKFDVHLARELHSIHALQFGLEGLKKSFLKGNITRGKGGWGQKIIHNIIQNYSA